MLSTAACMSVSKADFIALHQNSTDPCESNNKASINDKFIEVINKDGSKRLAKLNRNIVMRHNHHLTDRKKSEQPTNFFSSPWTWFNFITISK